ncbi:MAG: 4Fe-4S binding protein [Thermoguttaceae bacterium]
MAKQPTRPGRWRLVRWRAWVQAAFLLAWLDPLMLRMHSVCSPVFHCYSCPLATFACPIGILANFSAVHTMPWIALGILVAVGAVLGSIVCGWLCPFGFLQDLVARVPTPKFLLPSWLGYGRYAVLAVLVGAIPYLYGENHPLFFCRVCPAGAIEGAVPNAVRLALAGQPVLWPGLLKIVILAVFLVAMLFTYRPWCTVACPLGAIYGLFNYVSVLVVRFREDQCNDCDVCRRLCRHHGPAEQRAGQQRCIRCLGCMGCGALTIGTVFANGNSARPDSKNCAASGREPGR